MLNNQTTTSLLGDGDNKLTTVMSHSGVHSEDYVDTDTSSTAGFLTSRTLTFTGNSQSLEPPPPVYGDQV
ncbi:hypothetical protein C8Q75DRAFT_764873 [Abortiporus biennis]|nr:hypothetical protein C8Q75DRAFT_764873 [Abortiporus biennis]